MGLFFCKSYPFSLLIFSFLSFISITSSLSTFSISETSNLTLVCALVPSSPDAGLRRSSLNCSTSPVFSAVQSPFSPSDSFSGIVSGDGFVCGLSSSSSSSPNVSMHCWRFFNNGSTREFKRLYRGPALRQLEAGDSHICGLNNQTNALECWQWLDFNATTTTTTTNQSFSSIAVGSGFVCGLLESGNISCSGNISGISDIREGNYSMIADGFNHACAISSEKDLKCRGDGFGVIPTGQFIGVALGLSRSYALRENRTVVCWGQSSDFTLPQNLINIGNFLDLELIELRCRIMF